VEDAPVLVRDALVSDPRVLDAGEPLREAADLLSRPGVGSVLVVDGDRLVGAVSAGDLVRAIADGVEVSRATVGDVAGTQAERVGPDVPLEEAIHLMAEHDLDRLAVVEDGRLLGVLPRFGLVRRLAEDDPPADEPADGA
jgi:CBS domain-containing protein